MEAVIVNAKTEFKCNCVNNNTMNDTDTNASTANARKDS